MLYAVNNRFQNVSFGCATRQIPQALTEAEKINSLIEYYYVNNIFFRNWKKKPVRLSKNSLEENRQIIFTMIVEYTQKNKHRLQELFACAQKHNMSPGELLSSLRKKEIRQNPDIKKCFKHYSQGFLGALRAQVHRYKAILKRKAAQQKRDLKIKDFTKKSVVRKYETISRSDTEFQEELRTTFSEVLNDMEFPKNGRKVDLPISERKIIEKAYGLNLEEECSMRRLSQDIGNISPSGLNSRRKSAIETFRKHSKIQELDDKYNNHQKSPSRRKRKKDPEV